MTMTRYSTVMSYLRAYLERSLALHQGRPSPVAADELARLGEMAFPGLDGDTMQQAFELLAARSAYVALHPNERAASVTTDLEVDRGLLDAGLPIELLRTMREYADVTAERVMERESSARSAVARSAAGTDAIAMHYRGVWESGTYVRGAMATHDGTLWFCEADSTTDRPGTSKSWRLMVKNKERVSR